MRIVCLFNLKPGVDRGDYEQWARTRDIPGVRALGSIQGFSIHRATGLFGSDARAPYDYVEIIDVETVDGFVADVSTPEFQAAAAPFRDYADDPVFILTEDL